MQCREVCSSEDIQIIEWNASEKLPNNREAEHGISHDSHILAFAKEQGNRKPFSFAEKWLNLNSHLIIVLNDYGIRLYVTNCIQI